MIKLMKNKILNKFLVAEDKFMAEVHALSIPELHIVLVNHLLKTKKEYKNLEKQDIQDIFIKKIEAKLALSIK